MRPCPDHATHLGCSSSAGIALSHLSKSSRSFPMIHDRRWGRSERTRHHPLCGSVALKMRKIVHGHRTLAPRCLVEIVPVRFIIARVAEPRYVAAYRLQDLSGRRVVLTNQQNNGRAKILLSLRMIGNACPMLGDNVLNRIRLDPTCGEYRLPVGGPDAVAFFVTEVLPVRCNPEVRDLLRRYETCQGALGDCYGFGGCF